MLCTDKSVKYKIIKIIIFALVLVFSVLFASAVSADEAGFYVAVDYYAEKIRILNPNSLLARYALEDYMEIYDNDGVINGINSGIGKSDLAKNISVANDGEYMYALKAVSDDVLDSLGRAGRQNKKIAALRREKWFPIYGGGIDISKIIPARAAKTQRKQYYIAIRKADDVFDSETGYASRVSAPIKPRYSEKNLNKFIEYDAEREKIVLSGNYPGGDSLNIIYRYEYFDPISGVLAKDREDSGVNINAPGRIFYMGGNVYISSKPIVREGREGPEVEFARSREIRFRIPKISNMPGV